MILTFSFIDTSIDNSMGNLMKRGSSTHHQAHRLSQTKANAWHCIKRMSGVFDCTLDVWPCGRVWRPRLGLWPYILQSAPLLNNLIISQWPTCIIYTTKGEWQYQNTPESKVSSLAPASKGFFQLFEGELMSKFTLLSWPFWLNSPTTSTSAPDIKSPVNWFICGPITVTYMVFHRVFIPEHCCFLGHPVCRPVCSSHIIEEAWKHYSHWGAARWGHGQLAMAKQCISDLIMGS